MKITTKLKREELALLDAAGAGDVARVRRLLAAGVNADVKDDRYARRDVTPLMRAARAGHVEVVRALLAAGSKVTARDRHSPEEPAGQTPLHYAAKGRHVDVAEELLRAGAKIDAVGTNGVGTPLQESIYGDSPIKPSVAEIRKGILKKPASAAERKSILIFVKYLVSKGANANVASSDGDCPLSHAARRGMREVVEVLLDAGADVNHQDNSGWTAFVATIKDKHLDVALLLLERGVDMKLKDNEEWTHLHWAVLAGSVELVKAVLARGAAVNGIERGERRTALDLAVDNDLPEVAKVLKKAGARANQRGG